MYIYESYKIMSKHKYSHDNFSVNFVLKGFTSMQIGVYFLILGYTFKSILDGFLIDNNAMGMLSPQIIEILFIALLFLLVLFSSLALYFSGKRTAKRFQYKLFNQTTKKAILKYFTGIIILFSSIITLNNLGFINGIVPAFLILYSLFLFIFKNKERKNLLVLSGLSLALGLLCFVIPSYWYSSISILGIAHITYGFVVSK